jgi:hypothetical protein
MKEIGKRQSSLDIIQDKMDGTGSSVGKELAKASEQNNKTRLNANLGAAALPTVVRLGQLKFERP